MRILVVPVVTIASAAVVAWSTITIVGEPTVVTFRPEALPWGGRVFTSQQEFAAWLDRRGVSYETWRERHPGQAPWEPAPVLVPEPTPVAVAAPADTVGSEDAPGRGALAAAIAVGALLGAAAMARQSRSLWRTVGGSVAGTTRAAVNRSGAGLAGTRPDLRVLSSGAAVLRQSGLRAAVAAALAAREAAVTALTARENLRATARAVDEVALDRRGAVWDCWVWIRRHQRDVKDAVFYVAAAAIGIAVGLVVGGVI